MKIKYLFIGCFCALFSVYSLSCEFHDYGQSRIPKFPPLLPELHPVMLQHFKPPVSAPLDITLSADSNGTLKDDAFTINYHIHPGYHSVKAEVVSSKGVKVLGKTTMYLTRVKGSKDVKYQTLSDAPQNIRVRISAVRNDMPIIVEKRIKLSST
ncbi:hypothetical protein [Paraglaciecola sp. 2405UD69-4]|uniref:hypothetical protein n=1 Tax=Paraglaciecola sp. 2405UD69-4 TaxID=3391836 RepID=UPI0039C9F33D